MESRTAPSAVDTNRDGSTPSVMAHRGFSLAGAENTLTAFQAAWAALRDTHEFFGLLRRHGVSRTQALRLASPQFVQQVETGAAQDVLHRAAQAGTPIMVVLASFE